MLALLNVTDPAELLRVTEPVPATCRTRKSVGVRAVVKDKARGLNSGWRCLMFAFELGVVKNQIRSIGIRLGCAYSSWCIGAGKAPNVAGTAGPSNQRYKPKNPLIARISVSVFDVLCVVKVMLWRGAAVESPETS